MKKESWLHRKKDMFMEMHTNRQMYTILYLHVQKHSTKKEKHLLGTITPHRPTQHTKCKQLHILHT